MNNKGFMMAEVIVVAAVVLAAMVGFYTSYNKIISLYNKRVDYYDVTTLYELARYRDENYAELFIGDDGSKLLYNDGNKRIYFLKTNYLATLAQNSALNPTFKDYLEFLSTSLEVVTDNILIMENCYSEDKCKYAYLEVFENDET